MKDGYEEAIGISTPSKESLHLLSNQTALSRLASNKAVTIVSTDVLLFFWLNFSN